MHIRIFFAVIILWSCISAQAAEIVNGKQLTEQHCIRCHGTEVYTNANRTVHSLSELHNRIEMCTQAQKLNWQTKEIEAVANYLNQEFYHFK